MNCPEWYLRYSMVRCYGCSSGLQIRGVPVNVAGRTYYEIISGKRDDGKLEEQRAAAKAADADKRLDFLKLQVPVKLSTESDILSGKVTILVQGSDEISAHRFVLADKSPVFRKMFESEMTESKTGVISIGDASFTEMQTVVKFCYTAEIDFTEDAHAEEVLRLAHKYQILYLRDRCAEELCGRISKESFRDMMRLSRDYEARQLQVALAEYLVEHFGDVFPILLETA